MDVSVIRNGLQPSQRYLLDCQNPTASFYMNVKLLFFLFLVSSCNTDPTRERDLAIILRYER